MFRTAGSISQTGNISMVKYGDNKPIDENEYTARARDEICFVKVREMRWFFCCTDQLPFGEYLMFRCGRPSQLPLSVNLLLWGGLSGYVQDLDRKQSIESAFSLCILVLSLLFVLFGIPMSGIHPSREILLWLHALLVPLIICFDLYYLIYVIHKRFDTEMERVVSTNLEPIFRSYANCTLHYKYGRGIGTSHAYFIIKKLPSEDEPLASYPVLPLMSFDDHGLFTSTLGISNKAKSNNEVLVPVFGTTCFHRGLEMLLQPKELHMSMFVWGMILECFQKVVALRIRSQTENAKIIGIVSALTCFIVTISFGTTTTCFSVAVIAIFGWLYYLSGIIAMKREPFPSTNELHQEYAHALDEIVPIIEKNSMYHVEYRITNNGRSGHLAFRLKQQDNHGIDRTSSVLSSTTSTRYL